MLFVFNSLLKKKKREFMFVLFFVSRQFAVHLIMRICTRNDNRHLCVKNLREEGVFFFSKLYCGLKTLPAVEHDLCQEK